ncbi:hypothetical protein A0H81_04268 [Grifola frondosa]|uniref:Uncharacterized protein n=1 Tax=Grifola frondosa TaxID=5627 RepID=A0A1C7MDS9_GRIFR|nr:hypothetical protein A0H81_04268 [Grifola frondosa]
MYEPPYPNASVLLAHQYYMRPAALVATDGSSVLSAQPPPTTPIFMPSPSNYDLMHTEFTTAEPAGYYWRPDWAPDMGEYPSQNAVHSNVQLQQDLQYYSAAANSPQGQPLQWYMPPGSYLGGTEESEHSLAPADDTNASAHLNSGTGPRAAQPSHDAPPHDPFAGQFLRAQLGEQQWKIFATRLAEPRARRQNLSPITGDLPKTGSKPPVIDFLVKVEVVKSVLRSYVPHPYNPVKFLTYSYEPAPSGTVSLTRTMVLALCGWSNTQFSYWARRAEAISVLAPYDTRLRKVAAVLEQRLRSSGFADEGQPHSHAQADPDSAAEEWVKTYITGKGLDAMIEEVKHRTGVSPFLRGRHASLDPFGSAPVSGERGADAVSMRTWQAEKYVHDMPGVAGTKRKAEELDERAAQIGCSQDGSPPHGPSVVARSEVHSPGTQSALSSPDLGQSSTLSHHASGKTPF